MHRPTRRDLVTVIEDLKTLILRVATQLRDSGADMTGVEDLRQVLADYQPAADAHDQQIADLHFGQGYRLGEAAGYEAGERDGRMAGELDGFHEGFAKGMEAAAGPVFAAVEAARAEGNWPFPAPTTAPSPSTTTTVIVAPPKAATWWAPSSTNIRH